MKIYIIATDGANKWIDGQFTSNKAGRLTKKGHAEINTALGTSWYSIFYLQNHLSIRSNENIPYSHALVELAHEIAKAEEKGKATYEHELQRQQSFKCGNCDRPVTQTIAEDINRCERCANL